MKRTLTLHVSDEVHISDSVFCTQSECVVVDTQIFYTGYFNVVSSDVTWTPALVRGPCVTSTVTTSNWQFV